MKVIKNYDFVLDCSVTMAWCFEDESDDFSDSILERMVDASVVVPTIWPLEIANVLLQAQRKGRISNVNSLSFINDLLSFSIKVDSSTSSRAMNSILSFAEKTKLSIYDAAYLELAFREKIPLVTLDRALAKAAKSEGIALIE